MLCFLNKNERAFVIGTLDGEVKSRRLSTGGIASKYRLRVMQLSVGTGEIIAGVKYVSVDDRTRMAKHCKKHLKHGGLVVVDGTLANMSKIGMKQKANINISAGLVVT